MKSIARLIEDQVQKWQKSGSEMKEEKAAIRVITVSREPGSGGRLIAENVANALGYDLFHREILNEIADSAQVSDRLVKTLDERAMNVIDEWVASLVDDRHLWPDQYLKHLMKAVGTIAKHGNAVLVGRGTNFIAPPDKRFRVRIIAPKDVRIKNVASAFKVSASEAERRIIKTESERRAFIRKYFNTSVEDPQNYDLVINTGNVSVESAVKIIRAAVGK